MSSDSIWTLGSYTFPGSLTLINDTAIENIIADVPFVAVGLLGFGVITFFLVMKQAKLPPLVLHASVIIAFLATTFDLSQLISRGRNQSSASPFVSGLITARDIFLSIATGLRFLFFWLYVAEPPRGETAIPLAHSGTWGRWGFLGLVLKWTLLAMTLSMSILQVIWRVSSNSGFGTVYGAESAMEIIVSAVLLMKLILNVSITTITPRYNALRDYSAVIAALSINLGIGIGNVVTFAFSESALGRFFMAIEIYILIVYTLVAAFRDHVLVKPAGNIDSKAAVENLPETKGKSDIESNTPRFLMTTTSNLNLPRNDEHVASIRRTPSPSRFATWILPRKDSHRRSIGEGDRVDLWNQAEGADTTVQTAPAGPSGRGSPYSYQSFIDEERANRPSSHVLSLVNTDPRSSAQEETESRWAADTSESDPNSFSSNRGAEAPAQDSNESLRPPRMPQLDTKSSYSIGSYYGRGPSPADAQAVARESDSPIYALHGILRGAQETGNTSGSAGHPRDSGTSVNSLSFDELLRQQSEIDNSIAALRLLSPLQERIPSPPAVEDAWSPSGEFGRMPSSLHESDISLDDFPEPPNIISVTANGLPHRPPPSLRVKAIKQNRRSTRDSDTGTYLPMPRMPVLSDFDFPLTPRSIPNSPGRNSGDAVTTSRTGVDSVGTQYDVTSFIGNLMNPSSFKKSSALDNLADIPSEDGMSEVNENSDSMLPIPDPEPRPPKTSLRAKPAFLDSSLLAVDRTAVPYSPATASSGMWTASRLTGEGFQPRKIVAANTNLAGSPPADSLPANEVAGANLSPLSLSSSLSYGSGSLSARRLPPPAGSLPTRPRLTVSPPKPASPPRGSEGRSTESGVSPLKLSRKVGKAF